MHKATYIAGPAPHRASPTLTRPGRSSSLDENARFVTYTRGAVAKIRLTYIRLLMPPPNGAGAAPESWLMGKEAFEGRMPHHNGIKALWETKWRFPCSISVYPFHDGQPEDFAPIFEHLIEHDINDGTSAAYTEAFFPVAEALTARAETLLSEADSGGADATAKTKEASALLLRACCVYRIARFPYITSRPTVNDVTKWRAWEAQKAAYLRAAATWEVPICEVAVPHRHGLANEGHTIPVYLRLPPGASSSSKCPVMVLLTGLDGYRPDNTGRCDEFLARGWASVVLEIPGTADCPADPADPEAPDRLWDSLLAWMAADVPQLDLGRVACWGLSSGGYYAVRAAHTHASHLVGVVAQGAGVHHFFSADWLARADGHEYPFRLTPAMAAKHGFCTGDDDTAGIAAFAAGGALARFSLLATGILDQPSTRLLLINGTKDGLMPIEDSMLLFEHGTPKEARFFSGALHMGYPMANGSVYPWLESVMKSTSGNISNK
ncbi:pigment biosynthesis protein yellowish-green 1 [Grosmannia clavigera kw1407]|uniref:Pigment biosynthesis protein yellowish-green 1 n=1 Tax=Grosmannia clavigera (strain kw1407 / UAMH 11150) TaxID=655863 RepID=F0XBS9_GROCL|nr:pigment biosynthesis protein yellowish-green 1 [Grosmannia clavigera kw1407]EFX04961.1 pigment biosynthesis protein yellowish-green 1 [Grosmannia clavigera kw1407]